EVDGQPYYEMRLIDGKSLREWLPYYPPPTYYEAAQLMIRIARAIQRAHDKGILHRDLKPANILLANGRRFYIIDFGVAKWLDVGVPSAREPVATAGAEANRRDTTGLVGTLAYMAPELLADPRAASPASDVFSLGVIYYQLLTGRLPFSAEDPALLLDQ